LQSALVSADHVISILPDNAESVRFISSERLGWMKPGAIFYNIARGTTVDQEALLESLRSGHLGAAWLDVTDPEPLPDDHPLWDAPNCYITPHTAGGHGNESETLVRHFLNNLELYLGGLPLNDRII
jgi:phosphoglycerate dehydrogenase-like enzyme